MSASPIPKRVFIEPFAAFAQHRHGVPWLSTETNPKTMNVEWHAGSLGDLFKEALDCEGMYAALMEIWRKPRDRRGSFSHGQIGGRMAHVPHEIGRAAAETVRRHFIDALDELHNGRMTKRKVQQRKVQRFRTRLTAMDDDTFAAFIAEG